GQILLHNRPGWRHHGLIRNGAKAGATRQGNKNVVNTQIESQIESLRAPIGGGNSILTKCMLQIGPYIGMANGHSFGDTGTTRSKQQIRWTIGVNISRRYLILKSIDMVCD